MQGYFAKTVQGKKTRNNELSAKLPQTRTEFGRKGVYFLAAKEYTLSAKNFGAKYFGGKLFGGKNFGGILTISVINFGGIRKHFGGSRKFRFCQLKQKNLAIWLILTETEQNLYRM